MIEKAFTIGIYLFVGVLICLWAILAQLRDRSWTAPRVGSIFFSSTWTKWAHASPTLITATGLFLGLLLGSTLPWWRSWRQGMTLGELVLYVLLVSICLWVVRIELSKPSCTTASIGARRAGIAIFLILAIIVSFSTGLLAFDNNQLTAWHHWGAYVGPAELLLGGARPLYDFPMQYGLGPTLAIAAACGDNCWLGMYFVAGSSGVLLTASGIAIASLGRLKTWPGVLVATAMLSAAFMLWVAYGPDVASPTVAPSAAGLRFLPAAILTACLIWSEEDGLLKQHWQPICATVFAMCMFWSPEALFMAVLIFGPYYVIRRMHERQIATLWRAVLIPVLEFASVMLAAFAIFQLSYFAWLGIWPDIRAYLAYILYPPGPLPINPKGPVWFCLAALVLGLVTLRSLHFREGTSSSFRKLLAVVLLSYVSLSYALGRSHDNNFLNIAPYSALVLLNVSLLSTQTLSRSCALGMLASMLALLSLFGWNGWTSTWAAGRFFEFEPKRFVASLSYEDSETAKVLKRLRGKSVDPDAVAEALQHVRSISEDATLVWDRLNLSLPARSAVPWSALHPPQNYYFMPPEWRQLFIGRTAARIGKPGWLIMQSDLPQKWLGDIQTAYKIEQRLTFRSYEAIHFVPKDYANQ